MNTMHPYCPLRAACMYIPDDDIYVYKHLQHSLLVIRGTLFTSHKIHKLNTKASLTSIFSLFITFGPTPRKSITCIFTLNPVVIHTSARNLQCNFRASDHLAASERHQITSTRAAHVIDTNRMVTRLLPPYVRKSVLY